jgi:hypothetical protein
MKVPCEIVAIDALLPSERIVVASLRWVRLLAISSVRESLAKLRDRSSKLEVPWHLPLLVIFQASIIK